MYPTTEIELHPQLPSGAQFWTPTAEDLEADEGFGYFDNTWPIYEISEAEARELATTDRSLSVVASNLAATESEFDDIATALETGSADDIEGLRKDQLEAITPYLADQVTLEGLELGVAGLVYCLAAAGMYPAASCRGHPGPSPWSRIPVVLFAADRIHAELLAPLVRDSGCGFDIAQSRGELLAVESKSIEGTLDLADALLRELSTFNSTSLSDKYSSRDYWCRDKRVIWPGKRPTFSFDNGDSIIAIISCRDYSPGDELTLLWNWQAKCCCDIWVVILMP